MPYQIEITDTVPGTVFELRRVVLPEHIGAGFAESYAEVEAAGPPSVTYLDPLVLAPTNLVRTTGLAELEPVATEARERLAAALRAVV